MLATPGVQVTTPASEPAAVPIPMPPFLPMPPGGIIPPGPVVPASAIGGCIPAPSVWFPQPPMGSEIDRHSDIVRAGASEIPFARESRTVRTMGHLVLGRRFVCAGDLPTLLLKKGAGRRARVVAQG